MTKELRKIVYDPKKCRKQLADFQRLLASKKELDEQADLQPFFKAREQLTAFIGALVPHLGPASLLGFEFPFLGDFAADIVLGNPKAQTYCLIELEDGKRNSIFKKVARKATLEWSPRFEHGFRQLVDWFYHLDDFKKTDRFEKDFGSGYVRFFALLLIGRTEGVSDEGRKRLRWRTEKVRVDSHTVECFTFDDLHASMVSILTRYGTAKRKE